MAPVLNPAYTELIKPLPQVIQGFQMEMLMKILLILVVSCILTVATADSIYKWVDAQGVVHYGDEPGQSSAKKMGKLPGLSTYAPPPIKVKQPKAEKGDTEATESEEEATSYRSISIIKPEKGETIRSNPGIVDVLITLAPTLGKTDHIRVVLDGKPISDQYKKGVIRLINVDRGEHQLSVAVYNNKGRKLMSSASHTFYLHRTIATKKSPKN
jgi:hypothetical protein